MDAMPVYSQFLLLPLIFAGLGVLAATVILAPQIALGPIIRARKKRRAVPGAAVREPFQFRLLELGVLVLYVAAPAAIIHRVVRLADERLAAEAVAAGIVMSLPSILLWMMHVRMLDQARVQSEWRRAAFLLTAPFAYIAATAVPFLSIFVVALAMRSEPDDLPTLVAALAVTLSTLVAVRLTVAWVVTSRIRRPPGPVEVDVVQSDYVGRATAGETNRVPDRNVAS